MAVNVVARRRAQKDGGSCQIGWLAPAAGGNTFEDLAIADRVVLKSGGVVRGHVAGSDGVYVYSLRGPFVRQRLGELPQSPFSRGITRHQNSSLERKYRRDAYDLSR